LGTHAEGSWVERDDGYYEVGLPAAKVIAGNVTQLVVTEPGGRVLRGSVTGAWAIDTAAVREAARLALADPLPTGAVVDAESVEARVSAIERETLTELTGTITATNGVVVTATLDREPPAVLSRMTDGGGVGVVSAKISDDADNNESRAAVSIASPEEPASELTFDLTLDAAPTAVNPDGTGSVVLLLGEPGAARLASEAKTAAQSSSGGPVMLEPVAPPFLAEVPRRFGADLSPAVWSVLPGERPLCGWTFARWSQSTRIVSVEAPQVDGASSISVGTVAETDYGHDAQDAKVRVAVDGAAEPGDQAEVTMRATLRGGQPIVLRAVVTVGD
ncbi:MAG: hypothetical protein AAF805_00160, partial [Planctomycetota bacterium]